MRSRGEGSAPPGLVFRAVSFRWPGCVLGLGLGREPQGARTWPQRVVEASPCSLGDRPPPCPAPAPHSGPGRVWRERRWPMVRGLLGCSVSKPEKFPNQFRGAPCLRPEGQRPWAGWGLGLLPVPAAPPPGPPMPGREDRTGTARTRQPCNQSCRIAPRGLRTRPGREAGTCGGRAWQPPREQPVLGGPGRGERAERGNSVREEGSGAGAGPPPRRRKASPCSGAEPASACRWGLAG